MSSLVAEGSLKEFFKSVLHRVLSERRVEIAETTEFYLVNLLNEFVFADRLYFQTDDGRREEEPLAVLYHRALLQEREEKIRTLRRLGDVSLYKAGFFAESLREGMVGTDYYIHMGGAAYGQVADLSGRSGFSAVYTELCQKFRSVVEVLEEISARGSAAAGPQGALRVYETWVRTGSERLEKVLVDVGFFPSKSGLAN